MIIQDKGEEECAARRPDVLYRGSLCEGYHYGALDFRNGDGVEPESKTIAVRLRAPRAAAIAGIVFSVLLIASIVLLRRSVPADPMEAGAWLRTSAKTVTLSLNLVPFAGIAFLWFMGVLRDRLAVREDPFFATVFLGSGLLFLALLFLSSAVVGGIIAAFTAAPDGLLSSPTFRFGRAVTYEIMNVYTMKMAGVFMISTSTIALRTGIFPRWMTFLGLALALFLLFSLGFFAWAQLVFPLWVLMISVEILLTNLKRSKNIPPAVAPDQV